MQGIGRLVITALALSPAILCGCGPGAEPPPGSPGTPEYAGLDEYERRCERINSQGAKAQVVYEASKEMKVGDSETVRAAVTLDQSAPPEEVLPRTDAVGAPGVVVSCLIQARLSASKYEFENDNSVWIDRSVYETDAAQWVWSVTPKLGGDHTLTLFVRPIVREREERGVSDTSRAIEANIRDYTTRVHVSVPWNRRPEELLTQLASMLNVAEGLVKALTALILAISALVGAIAGLRHWRKRSVAG
jgi:hypothetical protein